MKQDLMRQNKGFSLLELLIAMTLTLVLLGIASTILTGAFSIRKREGQRTNALIAAQSALILMSREIANCGYGIKGNGIVTADSGLQKIHCRSNIRNNDSLTDDEGEDIVYYLDTDSNSIIRFDNFDSSQKPVLIPRVSSLFFQYLDFSGSSGTPTTNNTPSENTARVRIGVTIMLDEVVGEPENQTVTLISDVALRNSPYILSKS